MSVKIHMVTAGLSACGTSRRGQRFWKKGLGREEVGHWGGGVPLKGWGGFAERGQNGRGEVGLRDGEGLFTSDFSQNSCWRL